LLYHVGWVCTVDIRPASREGNRAKLPAPKTSAGCGAGRYSCEKHYTEVPNLSLTMYPFSISTDERVPLKFLMTKKLSEISKSTEVSIELLYVRIFGNKYIFPLNVPLRIGKCTSGWEPLL